MNKKILVLMGVLFFACHVFACTTAIVSGKYTKDGRPILWKLRDTESFNNKLRHFTDGKYPYIGLINSEDVKGKMVWGGHNSSGFAIMNSASFNTNLDDTCTFKDQEGIVMKLALQKCATLEDFEKLLSNLPKPMGLNANFGVIDANGGAAFYETDNYHFVKYDANDPQVAPNGYIIRSNFSNIGKKDIGYGFIRYQNAVEMFDCADAMGCLNVNMFIKSFSRSLKHSLLNKDYSEVIPQQKKGHFINSGDFICRYGSASSIIIEGVKNGEDPHLTTFWSMISFPLTTVAVPVWITKDGLLPKSCSAEKAKNALLGEYGLKLKDKCYPVHRSSGYKYMDLAVYQNNVDGGIKSHINKIEDEIISRGEEYLNKWRSGKIKDSDVAEFYSWLDNYIEQSYRSEFFPKGNN